jgi:cytochrome P450
VLARLFSERSLLAALSEMRAALGDLFMVAAPGFKSIFAAGPEANRQVLVTDRDKFDWRNETDAVTKLLRHGLLVEDGDEHDRLRACMDPPLRKKYAISNLDLMAGEVEYVTSHWKDGGTVDMLDEMRKASLLILMRASFHWDFRADLDRLWEPILTSIRYISPGPWLVWSGIPRPGYRSKLAELDAYLFHMISSRRADLSQKSDDPDPSDLLGATIAAGFSDERIRDQLLTMLIAGHDTSTALLSWAFYLLGRNPDKLAKAQEEVDRVLAGDPIRTDCIAQLEYLDCVAKEALRLYPPIHVGNRRVNEDMTVSGCPIKKGSRLMYSIYLSHRHPEYWEDPDVFEPERFAPDAPRRPQLTFVPFGGGPRNCIGASFAQVQSKVVLSHVLSNFDVELVEPRVRPFMGATLEPRPGVRMKVRSRAKSLFSPDLTKTVETQSIT